jgi:uncharacterized protein
MKSRLLSSTKLRIVKKTSWIIVLCVVLGTLHALAFDYPELTSWVNDYAGVLNSGQKQDLDSILKDFESATTNQIFVCIMESLPADTSLEEYVSKLFERWQPGQKDQDNGVLLALFIHDRKLRIEVGYGLEETLTDAVCGQIIRDEIAPAFKQGYYYQGIRNGISSLILATKNAYHPQSEPQDTFFVTILRTIYERTVNSKIWKNALSKIFPTFGTFVITLIVLLPSGVVLLLVLMNLYHNRGSTIGRSGSWNKGSSWSGDRSSSSSSSFSGGGGGSSGGGGASGSW